MSSPTAEVEQGQGRLVVTVTGAGSLADAPSVLAVTVSGRDEQTVRAETDPPDGDPDPAAPVTLLDRGLPVGAYEVAVTQDECRDSCDDGTDRETAVEYCRLTVALDAAKVVNVRVAVGLGAEKPECQTSIEPSSGSS